MDSLHSLKNSTVPENQQQKPAGLNQSPSLISNGSESNENEHLKEEFLGVLEVFIHQARDIHNICIYHKQDVYARLSLTSDPEKTVSTKIINGGGRNPVFNENVELNVRTIDTSLKCEIWMLSRVKNYLEDQLLGFALVPLSEVVIVNGKLEKEFSLSSNDLFHSPAGFVQLSLLYTGASPEVVAIPAISAPKTDTTVQDSDITKSHPSDYDMIEFPDPKIVNEDQIMVSEYFGLPCSNLDSERSGSLAIAEGENDCLSAEIGVRVVESFSMANENKNSSQVPKVDSQPCSVPTEVVSSPSLPGNSESSEAAAGSKSTVEEHVSAQNATSEKEQNAEHCENDSSASEAITNPVVSVSIEPEDKVVQQDIVDMYMKSMQEFTESLAKMKLPLDIDSGPPSSGSSTSDQTVQSSKNGGSRVFYGSRAFF